MINHNLNPNHLQRMHVGRNLLNQSIKLQSQAYELCVN